MNGGYPLRPVASARTRPVAGIAAQPGSWYLRRPSGARRRKRPPVLVTVNGYEYRNTVSADKRTNENLT